MTTAVFGRGPEVRVTHVVPTPFGQAGLFGGGERYPLELCRALAACVECELITFGRTPSIEYEPGGLRIRTLQAVGWQGGHPAHPFAPGLFGVLRGADIVHTHHMRSLPSRMAAVFGLIHSTSRVVTDHGVQGSSWGGLLPKLFETFLVVSAYSARELHAPPSRTRVIYGGADTQRFAPDPTEARHGVLFVGRLTPHKGIDRLLEALPVGARLRIVGSSGHDPHPPESDYINLLRRLAADRDVKFLGSLPDDELPGVYRSAQVLVLPSVERTCYGRSVPVSELLGLAVLEAMASGTPVIASRTGGLPEVVRHGETGFLIPPGDVQALRGRLEELLNNPPLARRLGANAHQDVLERFTWSKVAERCVDAYQVTLAQRAGRRVGR